MKLPSERVADNAHRHPRNAWRARARRARSRRASTLRARARRARARGEAGGGEREGEGGGVSGLEVRGVV